MLIALVTGCSSHWNPNSASMTAQHDVAGAPAKTGAGSGAANTARDIVTNGSIELTVADPPQVANTISQLTANAGGRIDSRTERAGYAGGKPTAELVLRIPATKLEPQLDEIKKLGVVARISIKNDDVTAQRVDLDARIGALQTSVDRLLGIMRESKTAADLLNAETTLSQRQGELDSLRAQRAQLGDQINFATLNVSLSATAPPPAPPEYRGFFGAIRHGWDALVSVGSSLGLTAGFLLPWLVVLVPIGFVVYRVRRRTASAKTAPARTAPASAAEPTEAPTQES